MITNLENKLKFIELIDEMKSIERTITLSCWRRESDADHSYHLAIMVLTFIEDFKYLDVLKCLKIALLHDIVEIFAWDTYFIDEEKLKTKKQREDESLKKIEEILWKTSFENFKEIIQEYEEKKSKEAIFVSQLDKLHPIIQIYLTWWRDFHTFKAKKDEVIANKYEKIDDEFWFRKVLDIYFEKMFENNMFYIWN